MTVCEYMLKSFQPYLEPQTVHNVLLISPHSSTHLAHCFSRFFNFIQIRIK